RRNWHFTSLQLRISAPRFSSMSLAHTFRAFRHRDYRIFWVGLFCGHTGTLIQSTAQAWLIFELTNSTFYLGLDGLCLGLPRILFSAFGGAVVDRTDRRLLFFLDQGAFLVMALFLGVMTSLGAIRVWHILAMSALTGLLLSFEQPIRQTVLAGVVAKEDLLNATSLYNLVFHGAVLFGPALGGVLIPVIGAGGCFYLNAASYVVVLWTIALIHIPKTTVPPGSVKTSLLRETVDVARIAWASPVFRSLLITLTIISLFTKSYTQFMPVFARRLGVGPPGLGVLLMAPGAGAIVGGLALASMRRSYRVSFLILLQACGFGLCLVLFSNSPFFVLSVALLVVIGAFQTSLLSLIASLLQLHAQENVRGRIMALFGLLNRGLGPMGAFPMGALALWIGAPLALSGAAVLAVFGTGYVTLRKPYAESFGTVGGTVGGSPAREQGS
ncbi:MAG TPA: MFS transporter, partial [Candidatus Binatia bacterium]